MLFRERNSSVFSGTLFLFVLLVSCVLILLFSEQEKNSCFKDELDIISSSPDPIPCPIVSSHDSSVTHQQHPPLLPHQSFYLVATFMFRNEGRYLAEWVEFHRMVGFDRFVLYNHNSTDDYEAVLEPYVREGIVELFHAMELFPNECIHLPNIPHHHDLCQRTCSFHAFQRYRNHTRWFGVFDVDEFMWPVEIPGLPVPSVAALLRKNYEQYDVLNFKMAVFGTNNIETPTERKEGDAYKPLVLEMNTRRSIVKGRWRYPFSQFYPKAMANPRSVYRPNVHFFEGIHGSQHEMIPMATDIRMSHYQFKNRQHIRDKRILNNVPFYSRYLPNFEKVHNAEEDLSIQYLLPALKEALIYRSKTQSVPPLPPKFSPDYDPSLFLLHRVGDGSHNPEIAPDICAAFLTDRRLPMVRKSITAFIWYMSSIEPWLTYEIVVMDNGSGEKDQETMKRELPIDTLTASRTNIGMTAGLNSIFFGHCRSKYILSMGEDWEARYETWPKSVPVMTMAMRVLDTNEAVLEVLLSDFDYLHPNHQNHTGWLDTPPRQEKEKLRHGPQLVQYRRLYPASIRGAYIKGASLKSAERLYKVGRLTGAEIENQYVQRLNQAGFAASFLCIQDGRCGEPSSGQGLFQHIG